MGVYRLYTGDDGQSHIEALDVSARPDLTQDLAVSTITFNERESGYFIDWHPAPRRQYVICIEGGIEIGFGRRLRPQLRTGRRPLGGGHHRTGPHHTGHRRRQGRNRHCPLG